MAFHQQRLAADEALPGTGIAVGIAAEIEAVEHLHQCCVGREFGQAAALQQLQRGIPIVVPAAFALEGINRRCFRPHAAVVVHRFHDRPAVAATHIPDHPVDVEQQDSAWVQGAWQRRLVG